jgi:proteasome lid subunit RPN8/RPN11
VLRITEPVVGQILAEAWRVYPEEACGLLLAPQGSGSSGTVRHFMPVENAAHSSRIFQLDPKGFMKAERFGDDHQLEVVGVMHSHTHTAAYPSATDLEEATKPLVPPSWHWLIVSLGFGSPELRSFSLEPSPGDFGEDSATGIAEETLLLTQ